MKRKYLESTAPGSGLALMIFLGAAILLVGCSDGTGTTNPSTATYSVTYDANGAEDGEVPVDAGTHTEGAAVSVLDNSGSLMRTGYTFAGWNTRADGSGTAYYENARLIMGTEDVTLYAVWTSGLTYAYSLSGWTAGITGYSGSDEYLMVPAEVDGYTVTYVEYRAFMNCTGLRKVTLPESVAGIGAEAFYGCFKLESITIPDSVEAIYEETLAYCDELETVILGDSVVYIGEYAFSDCAKLSSVTLANSVQTIDDYAFYYCQNLASITLPASVTQIGVEAFYECSSLESVYVNATTPPSLGSDAFENNAEGRMIYVPADSEDAYKASDSDWYGYADSIVSQ